MLLALAVLVACSSGDDSEELRPQDIVPRFERSAVYILSDLGILGLSSGTGIVLDDRGNVLTNNHVVAGAATIQVRVPGTTRLTDASIVGRSPCDDLAVIRVNRDVNQLRAAPLGSSATLTIGSKVYAVGFPIDPTNPDFTGTTMALTGPGVVSRLNGSFPLVGLRNLIQMDTTINHGNSGGPLIDAWGDVVGVNTLGFAERHLENAAYAIAIDEAKQVYPELLQGVDIDWVGVNITPNDPYFAENYGIPYVEGSAVILSMSEGPFEDAGWFPGDLIFTVANKPISNMGDLCPVLRTQRPGEKVWVHGWSQDRAGSRKYYDYETEVVMP